jgi:hypothetical protein
MNRRGVEIHEQADLNARQPQVADDLRCEYHSFVSNWQDLLTLEA